MHPEVTSDKPRMCPKCGMNLIKSEQHGHGSMEHDEHMGHEMKPVEKMSFWEKLKMSMSMTMGMEHGGLAGREMARLMELDIRNKFFVSLLSLSGGEASGLFSFQRFFDRSGGDYFLQRSPLS